MKNSNNRINRINYIVSENPSGVADLLHDAGFNVPNNVPDLILATKEWIGLEGREAIIKLLQVHPEREAILSANGNSEYDNYGGCGCQSSFSDGGKGCGCGCQSSYVPDPDTADLLDFLRESSQDQILDHYAILKKMVQKNPEDTELSRHLEITWDHIRPSSKPDGTSTNSTEESITRTGKTNRKDILFPVTKKDVILGTFLVGAAVLISQFK